jgi:hypothetical protein
MKYIVTACILFIITSCGDVKEKPGDKKEAQDNVVKNQATHTPDGIRFPSAKKDSTSALSIQSLKDIPKEISGCSGLYKLTNCNDSCAYVFASDLQGKAFIKSGERIIALSRVYKSITDKKSKERYEGEGYMVTIEVYPTKKTGDEVWEYYGELKVVKGDLKISESITGEVGC